MGLSLPDRGGSLCGHRLLSVPVCVCAGRRACVPACACKHACLIFHTIEEGDQ